MLEDCEEVVDKRLVLEEAEVVEAVVLEVAAKVLTRVATRPYT